MVKNTGMIFGIGIGPGGADMLTKRAVDCMKAADILCLPQSPKEVCRAYRVAAEAVPEIAQKNCLCFDFKMTLNVAEMERFHNEAYSEVFDLYQKGYKVAFLTIGDPAVYSTFGYILDKARQDQLNFEVISGIPSFCASAACLGITLCEGSEELHIGTGQSDLDKLLSNSGTIIIMKCGRNIQKIKNRLLLLEQEEGAVVYTVSECGMPDEKKYYGAEAIPVDIGYMSTIIVKKSRP